MNILMITISFSGLPKFFKKRKTCSLFPSIVARNIGMAII
jgi:hypothetical protein